MNTQFLAYQQIYSFLVADYHFLSPMSVHKILVSFNQTLESSYTKAASINTRSTPCSQSISYIRKSSSVQKHRWRRSELRWRTDHSTWRDAVAKIQWQQTSTQHQEQAGEHRCEDEMDACIGKCCKVRVNSRTSSDNGSSGLTTSFGNLSAAADRFRRQHVQAVQVNRRETRTRSNWHLSRCEHKQPEFHTVQRLTLKCRTVSAYATSTEQHAFFAAHTTGSGWSVCNAAERRTRAWKKTERQTTRFQYFFDYFA